VQPKITGPNKLWWFFGQYLGGYDTYVHLTASLANAGTYTWEITSGSTQARFDNNDTTFITGSNQVVIHSINSSGAQNDISVKVTIDGQASPEFKLTSLTPWYLAPNGVDHQPDATK
jgi:hypothetical protein